MRDAAWLMTILLALVAIGCVSPEAPPPDDPPAAAPDYYERALRARESTPAPRVSRTGSVPSRPPQSDAPHTASVAGLRFVVDAGHGGKDPGALGLSKVPEKSIALAMAHEVAGRLRAMGAHVDMTRTGDSFIELNDRARQADSMRCDLFISLHADASGSAAAAGVGVFVARSALESSRRSAQSILGAVRRAGIKTRAVQQKDFRVLAGHQRPAVLVECGFLSNKTDAANLNSPAYRARLAAAIVTGIVAALGKG